MPEGINPKKMVCLYIDSNIHREFMKVCKREGESASKKTEEYWAKYLSIHGVGNPQLQLEKFVGKELKMTKIRELMTFAAKMPCTLEFIYGYIKKIQDFSPLIIDVRVLPHIEWDFCETRTIWKVFNGIHFLQMLSSISFIAAKNNQLIERKKDSSLVIGPKGSIIGSRSRNVNLRSLFEIEVFSPINRTFDIHSIL